jgi:hypothetical protein
VSQIEISPSPVSRGGKLKESELPASVVKNPETVKVTAAAGASYTPNLAEGTLQELTLNEAACTLTAPTAVKGQGFRLAVIQDGTGGRLITWGAGFRFANGVYPTLAAAASAEDLFDCYCYDGTHYAVVPAAPNLEAGGKAATVPPVVQTALNLKQNTSEKGQASGYAELDAQTQVPATNLLRASGTSKALFPTEVLTYKATSESGTETKPVVAEPFPRSVLAGAGITLESGVPVFVAVPVSAYQVISGVAWTTLTTEGTAANRTHLWVALLTAAGVVTRQSLDYTSSTNTPLVSNTLHGLKFTETYGQGAENGFLIAVICEVMSSTAAITIPFREVLLGQSEIKPRLAGKFAGGATTPAEFKESPTQTSTVKAPYLAFI